MGLIPKRPFWEIEKFLEDWFGEDMIRMPSLSGMTTPRMNIYEDNGNVVAEVELPGVDPKNIDVEVKDNVLKVEAKTEEKKEEKKKDYYRKEISAGYYKRAVALPVEVKTEKAEATYADGILKIVIPKVEPEKEKKKGIKIKVKKS